MPAEPVPPLVAYLATAAVVAVVLWLRVRGLRRERPLRPGQLWIVPALYAALTGWMLYRFPPHGPMWGWLAVALAAGAAIGWRRAAFMRISVDPQTHALNQQASPAAIVFIVALVLVRQGLRYEHAALGLDLMTLTDMLMVLALGLFAATRAEMFLRARRLLAMARQPAQAAAR